MLEQPRNRVVPEIFGSPKELLENMANLAKCFTIKIDWFFLGSKCKQDFYQKNIKSLFLKNVIFGKYKNTLEIPAWR